MMHAAVTIDAVCGAVPARTIDNRDALSHLVGVDKAAAIVSSTGFPVRRVVEENGIFPLMLEAAKGVMEFASKDEIGGIVVASFSSRMRFPGLAVLLHDALKLPASVPAFDLSMACSAYPSALLVAGNMASSSGKKVLLVDGDAQSDFVSINDPSTVAVMSDAATATIVSASSSAEFAFLTKGSSAKVLECGASGPIKMDGFGVFKFVASEVTSFLRSMITECGKPDSFVPHQANLYMVRQLARSLGLEDVLCLAGETFANPGSASVPLSLAVNEVKGKTLLAAFGAGLSASAAMVDLSAGYKRKSIEV